MAKFITVDGGTTNTRISLVIDDRIICTKKYNIGAGNNDRQALAKSIKKGIGEIFTENNIDKCEIERILASGMITSEAGICELSHISTPCGICEMAEAMYETTLEEISEIPFVFSRGIKTNTEDIDVMRGEEAELLGLSDSLFKDSLYILPGSHTKLIYTDGEGRISDISTSLTGEMINVISGMTVLKNSVSLKASLNEEYLIKGYLYAKEKGVSFALFKVRMLDKFSHCNDDEKYSFFIGAALLSDVENMIRSKSDRIVVGGKTELRRPIVILLESFSNKKVIEIDEKISNDASAIGLIRVYKNIRRD